MVTRVANGGLIAMGDLRRRLERKTRSTAAASAAAAGSRDGTSGGAGKTSSGSGGGGNGGPELSVASGGTASKGGGVSEDDVVRAVGKLKCLGSGIGIVTLPDTPNDQGGGGGGPAAMLVSRGGGKASKGRAFVKSVPMELDKDTTACLAAASRRGGRVGAADLTSPPGALGAPGAPGAAAAAAAGAVGAAGSGGGLGWDAARADRALKKLLREGLAWVDGPAGVGGGPHGGSGDCFVLAIWVDDRSRQRGGGEEGGGEGGDGDEAGGEGR